MAAPLFHVMTDCSPGSPRSGGYIPTTQGTAPTTTHSTHNSTTNNAEITSTNSQAPSSTTVSYDVTTTHSLLLSTTNVFVAGLPVDFDECRLRALFQSYGDIFSCKIMVDIDSGISKGFGFVRYNNAADAAKAIEAMNGRKLNPQATRALYVTLAQNDGVPTVVESERVYVRNVPPGIGEFDLHQAFSQYGEVLECKVLRHAATDGTTEGPSKGVAFVRYRTVEDAHNAVIKAQGTRPFGQSKPLMVRFAETHEARQNRHSRNDSTPLTNIPSITGAAATATQQPPQPQVVHHHHHYVSHQPSPLPHSSSAAAVGATIVWEDPCSGYLFTTTVSSRESHITPPSPPTPMYPTTTSMAPPTYVLVQSGAAYPLMMC